MSGGKQRATTIDMTRTARSRTICAFTCVSFRISALTIVFDSSADGADDDMWDFGTVRHVGVGRNTVGRASQPPPIPPIPEHGNGNGNGAVHRHSPVPPPPPPPPPPPANGAYGLGDRNFHVSQASVATSSTVTLKTEQHGHLQQRSSEYPNRSIDKPLPSPSRSERDSTVRQVQPQVQAPGTPTKRERSYDDEEDDDFPHDEGGEPEYDSAMLDSVILPAIASVRFSLSLFLLRGLWQADARRLCSCFRE